MAKTEARWNGQIIAASDNCIAVEGKAYFPAVDVKAQFLAPSAQTSVCSWKGDCNYFDVVVDGKTNAAAGWVYNTPKAAADAIKGYVAFWKGVEVKGAEFAKSL